MGLCIGVAAGSQRGHKDLCLSNFTGLGVDHLHRLTRIVYKQLFSPFMVLSHHRLQLFGPGAVVKAKLAVAVAVRMLLAVFEPQQHQGHPFAFQFLVDHGPIWLRDLAACWQPFIRKQPRGQLLWVQLFRQRPVEPGLTNSRQIRTDRAGRNLAALGNRPIRQSGFIFEP